MLVGEGEGGKFKHEKKISPRCMHMCLHKVGAKARPNRAWPRNYNDSDARFKDYNGTRPKTNRSQQWMLKKVKTKQSMLLSQRSKADQELG